MKLTYKIPELKPQYIEILQHAGNSSKNDVIIMKIVCKTFMYDWVYNPSRIPQKLALNYNFGIF